jgi:hypothetical protein
VRTRGWLLEPDVRIALEAKLNAAVPSDGAQWCTALRAALHERHWPSDEPGAVPADAAAPSAAPAASSAAAATEAAPPLVRVRPPLLEQPKPSWYPPPLPHEAYRQDAERAESTVFRAHIPVHVKAITARDRETLPEAYEVDKLVTVIVDCDRCISDPTAMLFCCPLCEHGIWEESREEFIARVPEVMWDRFESGKPAYSPGVRALERNHGWDCLYRRYVPS